MLIGILSDTHDEFARTRLAVSLLREAGVEALIHCGDLSTPAIVETCAELPFYFAFGNHDADSAPRLREAALARGATCLGWGGEVTLGGKRIAVVHGHLHHDLRRLTAASPDYLLTGHSHLACDHRVGAMRRINPGALHRADEFSVAVLDPRTDELRFLVVTP